MNILAQLHGGYEELGSKVKTAPSYLSQINIGTRNVGESLARKLEACFGLPDNWMDQPHQQEEELKTIASKAPPLLTYSQLLQWHQTGQIPEKVATYYGKSLIRLEPDQVFVRIETETTSLAVGSLMSVELSSTPKDGDFVFIIHDGSIEFCRYKKFLSVECFTVKGRDVERAPGDQIIAKLCAWSSNG